MITLNAIFYKADPTYILCALLLLIISISSHFGSIFFIGYLRGNAIKIGPKQFHEIYEIIERHALKLELAKIPEAYILQSDGILNAFVLKFKSKDYMVLNSDILEIAADHDYKAISFIIGHELGHIKRKHLGLASLFIMPAKMIPFLSLPYSKACEYTCDNIAFNLSPESGMDGLLILAAGKRLYKNVNVDQLITDFVETKGFATSWAERKSTHPHLIKRIALVNELNNEYLLHAAKPIFNIGVYYNKFGKEIRL